MVKVGDRIPDLELVEASPGNKVNLSKELKQGKGVIIGVPAAFSKSLSTIIVPSTFKDHSARKTGLRSLPRLLYSAGVLSSALVVHDSCLLVTYFRIF